MPSRPESSAASTLRARASRLARIAGFTVVTAIALFCAMLLVVRFVLYPQIESHRSDIAAILSRELGATVEIDTIRTGWHGWNPELVVQGLRVRDPAGSLAQPLIELPEVTGVVSWTSLLTADLRLHELTIDRPRLSLRRDAAGRLHIAGLEIDATPTDADSQFTDWLLRQRLIVVRDALLAWNDELRNAPQLLLDGVHFRLENRLGHHRFGLRGTPPAEIAAPIDVRGDLSAASFTDWRDAAGRIYLRLDFADVAAWSEWVPLPVAVQSGQGAMRVWFDFAQGIARDMVADLELVDVRTRLASDLPAVDLKYLSGRVTWQQDGAHRALTTRDLQLVERDGVAIPPTNLDLRFDVDADGETTSGRIASSRLELGPLSELAAQLPLPARVRDELARHAPQGTLSDAEYSWEGPVGSPSAFRTRGAFAELGAKAFESLPGFTGLSGRYDATNAGGTLQVASRNAVLTMPKVFAEPLALDSAAGRIRWERRADDWSVRLEDVQYAAAHLAGTAQGTWKSMPKGPGELDLTARISRADAKHLYRYLPNVVGRDTRDWLRDALLAGNVDDVRMTLKGDLARFPFADGKSGTFVVTVNTLGTTLDYATGWPALSGVDAEVRLEGHRLAVTSSRGRVLGATLGRTTATIADLSHEHPVLVIEGEASGPTHEFLQFIRSSPVSKWIGNFTDDASASGNGKLALKIEMALGKPDAMPKVAGDYQFAANQLQFSGVPALAAVTGRVAFTERELDGRDLALETLGGAARVSISSRDGDVRINAAGNASLAAVHREFGTPLAARFTGATDWQLVLEARNGVATWTLDSTLRGVAVELPRPLGKLAAEPMPLKVERRTSPKDAARDAIVVDYGSLARAVAHRKLDAGGATVDRALLLLGKAAQTSAVPERSGITIRGNVDAANVDDWLAVASAAAPGSTTGGPTLELEAVELQAGELVAFGRSYDAMSLSARRAAQQWRMRFDSRQVDGTAEWEPAGSKLANGRFSAQLAKLDFTAMREAPASQPPQAETARREGSANPWPELDVRAERFIARAGNLGRMELSARPEGTDWRVSRFSLINEAGRVDAEGTWRLVGREQQTQFDVTVDVSNTSAFLVRMGFPGDVKGAPATLTGQLGWPGSPTDFDYEKLAGSFHVNVGAGQFTKMDPGVGKLLGVLSLQALPRRISLDFRDVFSEGFAFDTMAGNVRIANGIMHTDDLLVSGPAAKVVLAGDVDLSRETQQLKVRVQPSLSSVVSTGAGAAAVVLLAANPLIGAAVGAGTLLAQKIMQDPIEQMFSYEYAVRGSWSDPVVERVASYPLQRFGEKATAVEK
jgi:uncharacterized protein (TIGR02099 family)